VTVHAETGERILYVSPSFLKSIVGLTPRESQKILEILWEHITRPEYTVRFKWNEGDIAFWDNRSTVHLAPTDIFESDFDRQLYRVTLVGKPLVGVDGRPSKSIEGVPILSAAEELKMLAAAEYPRASRAKLAHLVYGRCGEASPRRMRAAQAFPDSLYPIAYIDSVTNEAPAWSASTSSSRCSRLSTPPSFR
jgi:Taurine catabolism dioxygenase TauD, TfdA family